MNRRNGSSSSLEWKVLADEEAEEYLRQYFLKKMEERENKDKKQATSLSQSNTTKVINTSRAASYEERIQYSQKTRRKMISLPKLKVIVSLKGRWSTCIIQGEDNQIRLHSKLTRLRWTTYIKHSRLKWRHYLRCYKEKKC